MSKYSVKVLTRVRCMSDGHHWFHIAVTPCPRKQASLPYAVDLGFDGWANAPAYVTTAIERQIGQMCREDKFKVYEVTQDGGERTSDLRYHDPVLFVWYGERW